MVEGQVKEQRLARDGLEAWWEVHKVGLLGDKGRVQAECLKPFNQRLIVLDLGRGGLCLMSIVSIWKFHRDSVRTMIYNSSLLTNEAYHTGGPYIPKVKGASTWGSQSCLLLRSGGDKQINPRSNAVGPVKPAQLHEDRKGRRASVTAHLEMLLHDLMPSWPK